MSHIHFIINILYLPAEVGLVHVWIRGKNGRITMSHCELLKEKTTLCSFSKIMVHHDFVKLTAYPSIYVVGKDSAHIPQGRKFESR